MRSHCHRRPCNYRAAIPELDDALNVHLSAVVIKHHTEHGRRSTSLGNLDPGPSSFTAREIQDGGLVRAQHKP